MTRKMTKKDLADAIKAAIAVTSIGFLAWVLWVGCSGQ